MHVPKVADGFNNGDIPSRSVQRLFESLHKRILKNLQTKSAHAAVKCEAITLSFGFITLTMARIQTSIRRSQWVVLSQELTANKIPDHHLFIRAPRLQRGFRRLLLQRNWHGTGRQ
jgi:hypothetical protein